MISERIARRYVKALFGLAVQTAAADAVGRELADLQGLYRASPDLRNALGNPRLPAAKKRDVLLRLLGEGPPPLLARFIDLLLDKRRLAVLHWAGSVFAELQDEAAGIRRGRVISALPLSEPQQERLKSALAQMLGVTVVLTAQVDPAVIGGVAVQVGDLMIDGTILQRLRGLQEQLGSGGPVGVGR